LEIRFALNPAVTQTIELAAGRQETDLLAAIAAAPALTCAEAKSAGE
jgi:hypothetical protein